jgi:hypothetical protein
MSRHLKKRTPKAPRPKVQKSPHLAANLPADPKDLYTQCTASWNGLEPLTAPGALFANIVPPPATITAQIKAVGDALPLAERGDATAVANLRAADDLLRATWMLVVKFCEFVLRKVPLEQIPTILAQIHMTTSGAGRGRAPKPPIAAKQVGQGAVRLDVLAQADAVSYHYEFSDDQSHWTAGTQTGRTDGTITGLKSGTLYYFRARCLKTDDTFSDYTVTVPLFVR